MPAVVVETGGGTKIHNERTGDWQIQSHTEARTGLKLTLTARDPTHGRRKVKPFANCESMPASRTGCCCEPTGLSFAREKP